MRCDLTSTAAVITLNGQAPRSEESAGTTSLLARSGGALGEISPDLALNIGDFGLGADSAVVLDYRQENPPVIQLVWRKPEPNTWVRCADTFEQFADMLGVDQNVSPQ